LNIVKASTFSCSRRSVVGLYRLLKPPGKDGKLLG
jgi:hypothetical protein